MFYVSLDRGAYEPLRTLRSENFNHAVLYASDSRAQNTLPPHHLGYHLVSHNFRYIRLRQLLHSVPSDPKSLGHRDCGGMLERCSISGRAMVLSRYAQLFRNNQEDGEVEANEKIAVSILADIALISIPIMMFRTLKVPTKTKIGIILLCCLGVLYVDYYCKPNLSSHPTNLAIPHQHMRMRYRQDGLTPCALR